MVAREPEQHEVGIAALVIPAVHGIGEQARPHRVGHAEHEPRIRGRGDLLQAGEIGMSARRRVRVALVGFGHLAEVDDGASAAARRVPEIPAAAVRKVLAARQVPRTTTGIHLRPCLFVVIVRERGVGPLVTVGAHVSVDVEVVEQHPVAGDRVGVRRHRVVEQRERSVSVAFRQVAEHLIVGPILPDHVDHVPERGREAVRPFGSEPRVGVGAQVAHRARVAGQRRRSGTGITETEPVMSRAT